MNPRTDIIRTPKQGYQWPHKKECVVLFPLLYEEVLVTKKKLIGGCSCIQKVYKKFVTSTTSQRK